MPRTRFARAASIGTALCCLGSAPIGHAASSTASSASDSASTSVGTSSDSIRKSSDSSSRATPVADGDYRVIDVAADAQRNGFTRVTLRALAAPAASDDDAEFVLVLPQAAVAQARLGVGGVISTRQRAYGTEFASGEPRAAFFLALADAWQRELGTHLVTPVVMQ